MTDGAGVGGPGNPGHHDEFQDTAETSSLPQPQMGESGAESNLPVADKRIGIATAVLLVITGLALEQVAFDREELGLGEGTHGIHDARVDGKAVRKNEMPLLEFLEILPGREQLTVWIGNSHQHAINAYQPGDRLSSTLLHLRLNGEQVPGPQPVFGLSYPNLRYEEQALLSMGLALLPDEHRPSVIVHGVRFHDARERGIRIDTRPLLKSPEVQRAVDALDPARFRGAKAALHAGLEVAMEERGKEEGLEPWLVRNLGEWMPIFRKRDFIYAQSDLKLHQLRDAVFRIDTTSKRPILRARYEDSMNALALAVAFAEERDIEVLLYNSPLRASVETPYVAEQYETFRRELKILVESNGGTFKDYDSLIPAELWGDWYDSDFPDFSHFTGAGHALLAKQVGEDILGLLGGPQTGSDPEASDVVQ